MQCVPSKDVIWGLPALGDSCCKSIDAYSHAKLSSICTKLDVSDYRDAIGVLYMMDAKPSLYHRKRKLKALATAVSDIALGDAIARYVYQSTNRGHIGQSSVLDVVHACKELKMGINVHKNMKRLSSASFRLLVEAEILPTTCAVLCDADRIMTVPDRKSVV